MITEKELKEIEDRADAASEGPWGIWRNEIFNESRLILCSGYELPESSDIYFIAHARTDIPKLMAGIRRLKEGIENLSDLALDFCECGKSSLQGDADNTCIFHKEVWKLLK